MCEKLLINFLRRCTYM